MNGKVKEVCDIQQPSHHHHQVWYVWISANSIGWFHGDKSGKDPFFFSLQSRIQSSHLNFKFQTNFAFSVFPLGYLLPDLASQ